MNNRYLEQLLQHLKEQGASGNLTDGYPVEYRLLLNEIHNYAMQSPKGSDGFMLACQDFLKEHGEPKHK